MTGTTLPVFLPKLAILASASVVTAVIHWFLISFRLTTDTQAHARDSLTAGSGDGGATFFAAHQALASRQLVTRAIDSVLDCRIDLVLYCSIFCKAASHAYSPLHQLNFENSGQQRILTLLIG
jgi:hypothetical protein